MFLVPPDILLISYMYPLLFKINALCSIDD